MIEGDEEEGSEELGEIASEQIGTFVPTQVDANTVVQEYVAPAGIPTELQLSINAISGLVTYQTMRVSGLYNKKLLHILIDSGSTHNFLDLELAKKFGCKLEAIHPLSVAVANGTKMQAQYVCRGFTWQLQQVSFTFDVMILPLGCCDLVLGVQWLATLGPILWDFQ